ncbi:MAG: hypothetical protein Q9196_007386, partial [Gyalolechia fulgens]
IICLPLLKILLRSLIAFDEAAIAIAVTAFIIGLEPIFGVIYACTLLIISDPLLAIRRHKKSTAQSAETEEGDSAPLPFLQMKAELDPEQQRYELEARQKGACELDGQNERQELSTQANVETRDISTLSELH